VDSYAGSSHVVSVHTQIESRKFIRALAFLVDYFGSFILSCFFYFQITRFVSFHIFGDKNISGFPLTQLISCYSFFRNCGFDMVELTTLKSFFEQTNLDFTIASCLRRVAHPTRLSRKSCG